MLNFTWATSHRSPVAGLPTSSHVPTRIPIDGSPPGGEGTGAVSRHLSQASSQQSTYLREAELAGVQRLLDRATRPDIARQHAKRFFHAAGMVRCKRAETPAVSTRWRLSAGVDNITRAGANSESSEHRSTNTSFADEGRTVSTGSPVTMQGMTLMPYAKNASMVDTLVSPGFFMVRPPPAYSWSLRYLPPVNDNMGEGEAQFERIRKTYGVPAYELLSAIARGTQLHENFLHVADAVRAFAAFMKAPARQTLNKSGEFFDVLAGLNATLAGKHRLTSLTLAILQVMQHQAVDTDEARMIDEALLSVIALQRAQRALQGTVKSSLMDMTTPRDSGDVTTFPSSSASASASTSASAAASPTPTPTPTPTFSRVGVGPTLSAASGDISEPDVTTTHPGRTVAAHRIACDGDLERADAASVTKGGRMALSWLDGVPLIWARDVMRTFAWRPLPLSPYEVNSDAPINAHIEVPTNASVCALPDGRTYIQIGRGTFRAVETQFGTFRVVGPEDRSLPPLPIVKRHDGWDFAQPDSESNDESENDSENEPDASDNETHAPSTAVPVPSDDGYVRWRNKKFICYGDQLRAVDASYIHGEEQIRALVIDVPERLDQPDSQGILWGPDGLRLVEGQYGYYPLLDGPPRVGAHGDIYRIAVQGRASMAEVSYDQARRRWHVLGAQRVDTWFSNVFEPANDIRVAHRLLSAGLALRLHATGQALHDAPFLQTHTELREALRMTCSGLVTRILRFQSRPATWSPDEQERLHTVWSALTTLLPAPAYWQQMPLVERQLLLAENVALFYDQFAPSFPLNGVLHQVQMTALGMDALDGTLPKNTLVQLKARLVSADGFAPYALDILLYTDVPALLSSFLHPTHTGDEEAQAAHEARQAHQAHWHRASFAAWLYDNRASVALINFSALGGICSFEHAASEAEVADDVDRFLWETPRSEGLSFVVSPRDTMLDNYVSKTNEYE